MTRPIFATLGPKGSNHDRVLHSYLARENISAEQILCDSFDTVLEACASTRANRIFVCAAHSSCGHVIGTAQYQLGLKITDSFVSESQPLAILHRTDKPTTIALQPATRSYVNLDAYQQVIEVNSTVAAAEGLKSGAWDAALTATRFADDDLSIAVRIPSPRDAWLILGGEERISVWGLHT